MALLHAKMVEHGSESRSLLTGPLGCNQHITIDLHPRRIGLRMCLGLSGADFLRHFVCFGFEALKYFALNSFLEGAPTAKFGPNLLGLKKKIGMAWNCDEGE